MRMQIQLAKWFFTCLEFWPSIANDEIRWRAKTARSRLTSTQFQGVHAMYMRTLIAVSAMAVISTTAHAGCGIVADSDPDGEAEELMWKLRPLLEALA